MENQEYFSSGLTKAMKPKHISLAECFRKQNLSREPVDLLTGDNSPIPKFPPPLVPLPFEPLRKSQILSLYDIPFAFLLNQNLASLISTRNN